MSLHSVLPEGEGPVMMRGLSPLSSLVGVPGPLVLMTEVCSHKHHGLTYGGWTGSTEVFR